MKKYPVLGRIKFNGTLAKLGEFIDLPDGVAAGLLKNKRIGPALSDEAAAAIDKLNAEVKAESDAAAQKAADGKTTKSSKSSAAK